MRTLIESLESRQLFSAIPASFFAGPQVKGATSTYEVITAGKQIGTDVRTVAGPATFNGHSATRITDKQTINGSVVTNDLFETLTSSKGLQIYGTRSTRKSGTVTTITTRTFTPTAVYAPATINPGSTYTVTFQQKDVTTVNGKITQTVLHTIKLVDKVSAKTKVITLPAGKFTVYEVDVTRTDTVNKVATVSTEKDFFASGDGLVEAISGTGASQTAIELKSFKI